MPEQANRPCQAADHQNHRQRRLLLSWTATHRSFPAVAVKRPTAAWRSRVSLRLAKVSATLWVERRGGARGWAPQTGGLFGPGKPEAYPTAWWQGRDAIASDRRLEKRMEKLFPNQANYPKLRPLYDT